MHVMVSLFRGAIGVDGLSALFTFESVDDVLNASGIGETPLCLVALVGSVLKQRIDGIIVVRVVGLGTEASGGSLVDKFGSAVSFDALLVSCAKIEAVGETTHNASRYDAP